MGGGYTGPSATKAPSVARVEAVPPPLPAGRPRCEWPRAWLRAALLLRLWARQCRSLARARYYCQVWRLRRGASRLAEWRHTATAHTLVAAEATRALSLRASRRSLASWALLASRGRVLHQCTACGAARRQVRTFRAWRVWQQLKLRRKVRRRGEGAFGYLYLSMVLARWRKAAQARRRLGCTAAVAERSLQRHWLARAWRIQCARRAARSARRALLARANTAARLRAAAAVLQAWRWAAWVLWAATASLARSHPAWAVWRAAQRRHGGAQGASLGVAAAAYWAAGGSGVAWRRLREAGAAHRAVQSAQEWRRLRHVRGALGRWGVRRAIFGARTRVRQEAWTWWRARALRCGLRRWRLGPRAEALCARARLRRGLGAWVQAGCTARRAAASRALRRALVALRAHRHACHSGLLSQLEVARACQRLCPTPPQTVLNTALALGPWPQSAHMLTRVHGLAVWQLLRTAREGLQSEIGLRTKLAADWARAESSAGYSSAEPVPELDGGRVGALHAEGLARCSRDAAVALSLSMRTFAWQVLPLKQVAGNHKAVQAPRGRGGSSASALCSHDRPFADRWV